MLISPFLVSLCLFVKGLLSLCPQLLLVGSPDFEVLDSDLDGKSDPSKKLSKSYRVFINSVISDTIEVFLDELQFLEFLVILFLRSERPVLAHSGEQLVVLKEHLSSFPLEFVGISLAKVLSILEFQDVEERLPDSRVLNDVEVSEISDFLFPLFWHERGVNS